ncbi:MAG: hypothetical protein IKY70_03105 [Bacteroidales bacterium]|nr:hypothetical protein [Bacteroidales bacterium]
MKRIFILLAALCSTALLAGCNDMKIESGKENISSDEGMCEVTFNATGEITTSDSPLAKSSIIMTDDIYFAQVYNTTDQNSITPFAFGYFDNLQSMKLCLKKSNKYRIVVSVLKNGKNLLADNFCLTQNSIHSYGYKNIYTLRYSSDKSLFDYWIILNSFYYNINNSGILYYYSDTSENVNSTSDSYGLSSYKDFNLKYIETTVLNGVSYPTCDDWFYGEAVDFVPDGDYQTLDMDFKRVGFKLKYELSGVTDGEVTVKVFNDSRTFIENTTSTSSYVGDEQFIAFNDAKSAWQYAADYSENMQVSVVWLRSIGVTQDLGTKTIQVKRNCLNNIKIALGSDDKDSGVLLNIEEDSNFGGTSSTEIPVE